MADNAEDPLSRLVKGAGKFAPQLFPDARHDMARRIATKFRATEATQEIAALIEAKFAITAAGFEYGEGTNTRPNMEQLGQNSGNALRALREKIGNRVGEERAETASNDINACIGEEIRQLLNTQRKL